MQLAKSKQDYQPQDDLEKELINEVLSYNSKANVGLIIKAYRLAKHSHKGQKRFSGEDFITHPYEVAKVLTTMKLNSVTIAAGLLHDTVEDTKLTIKNVEKEFGKEVASLVEGVTKIKKIDFKGKEHFREENIRKVLLATAKDIRVILIKLADRLHNMQTLKNLPIEKQKSISKETLEIYAPVAHKLGMLHIKNELEDLSLRFLDPESFYFIVKQINQKKEAREKEIKQICKYLKEVLKEKKIQAKVYGRAKHIYSIYQKIKKGKSFDEIYDLRAIRIIVNNVDDCYKVLGLVHSIWKPVPNRFKDYIALPRGNMYQSLHTSIIDNYGRQIEVQIRTKQMHHFAEEGVAAHWLYKGREKDSKFDKRIAWIKQVLEWERESSSAKEFIETLKIDLFDKEVYVFTPKGDVIELPEKSTPVDFAFSVHTNLGLTCNKAKVNNKLAPLHYKLKSGDVIEIITRKNSKPSKNWLNFVRTSKARSSLRKYFKMFEPHLIKDEPTFEKKGFVKSIEIEGYENPVIRFCRVCLPLPGEDIVAYLTKTGKVAIHKKNCKNVKQYSQSNKVNAHWKTEEAYCRYSLKVIAKDRVGLLADLLNVISSSNINIMGANGRSVKNKALCTFIVEIDNIEKLNSIMEMLRKVDAVISVFKC